MSSVIIAGNTSGSITLDAPNVAGTTTLTLPTTTDTLVGRTTTDTLTNKTLTSPVMAGTPTGVGVLTAGTAVASTSGTSISYTGIPSWVKRITVMYTSLSTNGSSTIQVQLGTSGGLTTSGYLGSSAFSGASTGGANLTTGLPIAGTGSTDVRHGHTIITNVTGNIWVSSHANGQSNNNYAQFGGGSITLSGTLTQLAINMANGTDTFDSGSINILYE